MKTKVVQILISRNLTSEPSDVVLLHEVPILKVVRGAGAITVTDADCKGCELKPKNVNSREELIRLKRKYKGFINEGQHPVDVAYPDGSRDLELFYESPELFDMVGEEEGGGVLEDEVEDESIDDEGNPVAAPEVPEVPEALDAPETPALHANADLEDRDAVKGALAALNVAFAPQAGTKNLAALLTKTLEEQKAE